MQIGNITLASQRFSLTRCNCTSQDKKRRNRISKEERRAMVETFITKHRETNKGSFPSINLTHKECGGSFYKIREIIRDIIQENRVLGPGDLDMQSLTLEDKPVQPEICLNGTGTSTSTSIEIGFKNEGEEDYIEIDYNGNGNGLVTNGGVQFVEKEIQNEEDIIQEEKLKTGDLHEEYVMESKMETIERSEEIKEGMEEIIEIPQDNGKLSTGDLHEESKTEMNTEIIDESEIEIMEEMSEISLGNGKLSSGDLHEVSEMEINTKIIEKSEIEIKEEIIEISQNNGKLCIGDLHEDSKMEIASEKIEKSGFEIKEEISEISQSNGKLSTGDLHEESKMEITSERIEKSEFEICKNNGKISTIETEKLESSFGTGQKLGFSDSKSNNEGFEMAKRTVVQVEQFPLPSKINSSKIKESVSSDEKVKEPELVEAKKEIKIKNEIKDSISSSPEKNIGATMPKSEKNISKIKRGPINEYLMRRHESYLKYDFLTTEMNSLDASINRETSKKKREKAEANPFWVTFQAFLSSVIKFWTE